MKLTAFTDYCLRVLIYLAAAPSQKATIAEIARSFDVSEHHLVKVVHFLGRKGWIATVRGKGGGMSLARPPEDIVIGQVVRDAEGELAPAECFETSGGRCTLGGCCQLKGVLGRAIAAFYAVLDTCTLAQVTTNEAQLRRALHFIRVMPESERP